MSRSKLAWKSGADGATVQVGDLVRWRHFSRGPLQYGFYRGVQDRILTFSDDAQGPVTLWMAYLPPFSQKAVIERVSDVPEPTDSEADRG